jgi:hypothetical protein
MENIMDDKVTTITGLKVTPNDVLCDPHFVEQIRQLLDLIAMKTPLAMERKALEDMAECFAQATDLLRRRGLLEGDIQRLRKKVEDVPTSLPF